MSRRLRFVVLAALAAPLTSSFAAAEQPAAAQTRATPEQAVVDSLRANPLILPYAIRVTTGKGGEIILAGKVGTKAVHDMAIRTVIDLGLVPHDDLVIDTAEAQRVALEQSYAAGAAVAAAPVGPPPYFVYPEPLFGRLDDPFWGFEPPILSIPPSYARRGDATSAAGEARPAPTADERLRRASAPVKGQVHLSVDEFGQVSLSGVVASEEDKRMIEQEARKAPGVTRVSSDLRVASRETPPPPPQPLDGKPIELQPSVPPPPAPGDVPAPAPTAVPAPQPVPAAAPAAQPGASLSARAEQSLERRPSLKGLGVDVQTRGDVATITGKVPSAYEAMLAYRAVEQTAGVREVVDDLEFPLPDEDHPNPLRTKGRPDDLEPYFLHQIRRHAGQSAHVDRVRVQGDVVQVRGSLPPAEDPARLDALLRSIPLLRDFHIESTFTAD
ncbi:BON domain-containing protein [Paludisphaera mucosa]|uniref:BON domain-containing protein n=1 Tax=Paludisphaera mucosa TaxID=3030827 RepID=A0ABT6F986_9BACT|nr:BON domain-containing protein [Paludisphaera mucosa]MDG3004046.1 BON domain-containing protein [Paludisphaera mucosa]